jgi:hypothetical protein
VPITELTDTEDALATSSGADKLIKNAYRLVFLFACGVMATAAETPLGVVRARGDIRVDNATVSGNSTIFSGSVVETGDARSHITLNTGGRVVLISGTRAALYQDRFVLQKGATDIAAASALRIEAGQLRISAPANSRLQVGMNGTDEVQVAAVSGQAEVRNSSGILIARVLQGEGVRLRGQDAPGSSSKLSGTLSRRNGRFFLTDETSRVTVELRGTGLERVVGSKIQVTGQTMSGVTPAAGASHVVSVSEFNVVGGAASGAAGKAAAAGMKAGLSKGAIAVIGGVAVAGTVGTLYATDVVGGDEETTSRR